MEVRKFYLSFSAETFVFQYAIKKYKDTDIQNYNSAFCLCGYETRSLTVREEHRLRVVENAVLRKLFGPMREEVTGSFIVFTTYTIFSGNQDE
jgi:hypothetical protein